MNVDELGDRCKALEMAEAGRKAMRGISSRSGTAAREGPATAWGTRLGSEDR